MRSQDTIRYPKQIDKHAAQLDAIERELEIVCAITDQVERLAGLIALGERIDVFRDDFDRRCQRGRP